MLGIAAIVGLTLAVSSAQTSRSRAAGAALDAAAAKAAAATYRELIDLLSIPNVSVVSAPDMQRNAAFLDAAFQKRGFKTTVWPNDGRPVIFAELPNANPARKTVLFYMHMDGQPVVASEWDQQGPFEPALKRKTADSRWETLPLDRLFGPDVDPEWRIFARSAGDDKGPIVMFLAAVDAMHATGREPAINLKVILDPEEESGGARGFRAFIAERQSLLASDGLVVFDGPQGEDNRPLFSFGFRGGATVQLTVFGPRSEVHSGNYGNYAPNPMQRLARLVGSMKDDDGRVTIPGFYDAVTIDEDTSRLLAAAPDEEAALNERLGIAAREKVGRNLREALMYPTLTLTRMVGGSLDKDGKLVPFAGAVIPAVAVATIAIRTVPETPAAYLRDVFTKYVASQGYQLVAGQPTDEERRRFRNLAALTVSGNPGVRSGGPSDPLGAWLRRASRKAFGAEANVAPMLGASLPIDAAIQALKVPFVIAPLANGDDNQHAANENLRLGNYLAGVKSILYDLLEPVE
jgi:acetylornithine deacetylase/succinyl-diaminopimelate desuccinylase-like protein